MPSGVPEHLQSTSEPQHDIGLLLLERPVDHCSQVVEVGLDFVEREALIAGEQLLLDRLDAD